MSKMKCFQLVAESLSTNIDLSVEDIRWCANEVCKIDPDKSDPDQILIFALLSNRKTISGRYARTFNLTLKNIIQHRSFHRLASLIGKHFTELYPEIYDNNLLTPEQVVAIEDVINREAQTFETAILNQTHNIVPHVRSRLPREAIKSDIVEFEKAHLRVSARDVVSDIPYIPKHIYIMDNGFTIYKLERHPLLMRLVNKNYINPKTGRTFNPIALESLLERFDIEIKLLKYRVYRSSTRSVKRWQPNTPLITPRRSSNRQSSPSGGVRITSSYRVKSVRN